METYILPEEAIVERLAKCKNDKEMQILFNSTCEKSGFRNHSLYVNLPYPSSIEKFIETRNQLLAVGCGTKEKNEEEIVAVNEYLYRKANNLLTIWYFKAWYMSGLGDEIAAGFLQSGTKIAIWTMVAGRIESNIEKIVSHTKILYTVEHFGNYRVTGDDLGVASAVQRAQAWANQNEKEVK